MNADLTYKEAIRVVVDALTEPISRDEFVKRVLTLRPSTAKNPRRSVLTNLYEWRRRGDIVVLDDMVIPARFVMAGQRFAVPIDRRQARRGALEIYAGFRPYRHGEVSPDEVHLEDERGQPLPTRVVTWTDTVQTVLGPSEYEVKAYDLQTWFERADIRRQDYVLVTVLDWEQAHFRLQHEKAKERRRHRDQIEAYNQKLADKVFELLEAARDESIPVAEAVVTALAQMPESRNYPGDFWWDLIEHDPRMKTDGFDIRYAEWRSPFGAMLDGVYGRATEPAPPVSKAEANRVYRVKAMLKHRRGLWRRIEVLGGQTLFDFDQELRTAFELDRSDHLSGFWKLVRRGKSRRFREVDLGTINPFEGGDAAELQVAALDLAPGDALKYVYDFGDWIEVRIEVEAIDDAPEKGADYPRVVAKNRPRYRYCEHCAEKGQKSVATWICLECSNAQQRQVLVCDSCAMEHHPEHWREEFLY